MGAQLDELIARFAVIEQRLTDLESALNTKLHLPADDDTPAVDTSLDLDDDELLRCNITNASPIQLRLHAELQERGVRHRFVHAPQDYYSQNLLYRKCAGLIYMPPPLQPSQAGPGRRVGVSSLQKHRL